MQPIYLERHEVVTVPQFGHLGEKDVRGIAHDHVLEAGASPMDLQPLDPGVREALPDGLIGREGVKEERNAGPGLDQRLVEDQEVEQRVLRDDRADVDRFRAQLLCSRSLMSWARSSGVR
jgi:hypothetical protein